MQNILVIHPHPKGVVKCPHLSITERIVSANRIGNSKGPKWLASFQLLCVDFSMRFEIPSAQDDGSLSKYLPFCYNVIYV